MIIVDILRFCLALLYKTFGLFSDFYVTILSFFVDTKRGKNVPIELPADTDGLDKPKSTVIFTSVLQSNFTYLEKSFNINIPLSNWLEKSAEVYGLINLYSRPDTFSSFQLAGMFTEYVNELHFVSDAEHIKEIFKIPYSEESVSMVVHKIGDTLLIDNFDIKKHIMEVHPKNIFYNLINKFFIEDILMQNNINDIFTHKVNTVCMVQEKSLNSKFLHHSVANQLNSNMNTSNIFLSNVPSFYPLSDLLPEDEFPDNPNTHQLFNYSLIWTFNKFKILLGTDLPIFKSDTSCISLRLRDMSKPVSVLTTIDYWLDNLICNIPEVIICNHINGIVQNYESIKTENLPYFRESSFSPKVIQNSAQKIFSYLKSTVTNSGCTYWIFKKKNDDMVNIYNLASHNESPFKIPLAILFYRVAINLIDKMESNNTYEFNKIKKNFIISMKLLNKTKYRFIFSTAYYILTNYIHPIKNNNSKVTTLKNTILKVDKKFHTTIYNDFNYYDVLTDGIKPIYPVDVHNLYLLYMNKI